MTTLPAEAIRRIADRRLQAEADLTTTLSRIPISHDRAVYLPAFAAFATALFDSEAAEFLEICNTASNYRRNLEEVADRIIEGILPDRSLQRVTRNWSAESGSLSIEQEIGSEAIWEVGEDRQRWPARAEIQAKYAKHGDWERFMPQHMRFFIRNRDNAPVREELRQVFQRRLFYWEGQFRPGVTAAEPTSSAVSEGPASGCVTPANATPEHRTDPNSLTTTGFAPEDPAPVGAQPKLNVEMISNWMDDEGYDNKELADLLKISVRTVSSLRNNGNYHGSDALTKLANRMKRDVEDLYLP